jgi:hypothetical protein
MHQAHRILQAAVVMVVVRNHCVGQPYRLYQDKKENSDALFVHSCILLKATGQRY